MSLIHKHYPKIQKLDHITMKLLAKKNDGLLLDLHSIYKFAYLHHVVKFLMLVADTTLKELLLEGGIRELKGLIFSKKPSENVIGFSFPYQPFICDVYLPGDSDQITQTQKLLGNVFDDFKIDFNQKDVTKGYKNLASENSYHNMNLIDFAKFGIKWAIDFLKDKLNLIPENGKICLKPDHVLGFVWMMVPSKEDERMTHFVQLSLSTVDKLFDKGKVCQNFGIQTFGQFELQPYNSAVMDINARVVIKNYNLHLLVKKNSIRPLLHVGCMEINWLRRKRNNPSNNVELSQRNASLDIIELRNYYLNFGTNILKEISLSFINWDQKSEEFPDFTPSESKYLNFLKKVLFKIQILI